MTEALPLLWAGAAGVLLGLLFFGGLWWTLRRGLASQRAALWFFGSLVLRTGLVLAGFYLVFDGQWQRLLACVLGFTLARLLVTRLTRPPAASQSRTGSASHAP